MAGGSKKDPDYRLSFRPAFPVYVEQLPPVAK